MIKKFKHLLSPLTNKRIANVVLLFEANGKMTIRQTWIKYNQAFRADPFEENALGVYIRRCHSAGLLTRNKFGAYTEYAPNDNNLEEIKNRIEKSSKEMEDEFDYFEYAKRFRLLSSFGMKILEFIDKEKPISVEIIHLKTGINLSQLSRELKKLEKLKWIQLIRSLSWRRRFNRLLKYIILFC